MDTTCYAQVDVVERVAQQTDLFLCDLKHMDSEQHELFTGVRNELILSNIRLLSDRGRPLHLRVPLIPGFNDQDNNIQQSIDFIKSIQTVQRVDILPYNRAGLDKTERLGMHGPALKDFGPPDETQINRVVSRFGQAGIRVKVGG